MEEICIKKWTIGVVIYLHYMQYIVDHTEHRDWIQRPEVAKWTICQWEVVLCPQGYGMCVSFIDTTVSFGIKSATKGVCNKKACLAEGSTRFACTFSDSSMHGRSSLLQRKPTMKKSQDVWVKLACAPLHNRWHPSIWANECFPLPHESTRRVEVRRNLLRSVDISSFFPAENYSFRGLLAQSDWPV